MSKKKVGTKVRTDVVVDEDRRYGTKATVKLTREEVRVAVKANKEEGKVRLFPDLSRYEVVEVADGRKVQDNGDAVAKKLREAAQEDLYKVAAEAVGEETAAEWKARYAHLNPGMQRMNVGNKLRGHYNAIAKKQAPAS